MELIAKYHVETDLPIQKAAEAIAAEQSTGTWTAVRGQDNPLAARVILAEGNNVEIGFPEELFEPGNIPQYLSVVAGNLFGLGDLKKVRLQDIIFPESLLSAHKGPRFGIEDARKILGVYDRPLVGTIVKPKVGLDPAGTARVAAAAVRGGLDLVKDDETLTDQSFCPLIPRLEAVMAALDKVETETGKKAFYAVNVTAGADKILERAEAGSRSWRQHGHDRCPDGRLLRVGGALPASKGARSCAQNHARSIHQRQRARHCHAGHFQAGAHDWRHQPAYWKLHGQDGARNPGKRPLP